MSPLTKEIVNYRVDIISDKTRHRGFIESLCDDGIYMRTLPEETQTDFIPGARIQLKILLPSGETQYINCIIKWAYKTPPHGLTTSIGVSLLTPIPNFYMIFESGDISEN